jgi:ATP-dependent RNA helicase DHX29
MAGGKKKKKPASNPARGFATTSIASKPKIDAVDVEIDPTSTEITTSAEQQQIDIAPLSSDIKPSELVLSPEEFEKQLENSELQVLVEKYAQKSKRDAQRQKNRLETERRLFRSQAENLNTRKWLPLELMEEILDLVKLEGRFLGQTIDSANTMKQASEEELTIRLWTLQQALTGAGFLEAKVLLALQHVLGISDKIGTGSKDSIWGMEECLDWLSRECSREELPDYDIRKPGSIPKSQAGKLSLSVLP